MEIADSALDALRPLCEGLARAEEGGTPYLLLKQLRLPTGCSPAVVDALLGCGIRDGYNTRLFYSSRIEGPSGLNWNACGTQILGKSWWAYSWRVPAERLSLREIVDNHLQPLRQAP